MKIIHYIISVIFLLFALVQYNDPDGLIWIPVYTMVSVIALAAGLNRPIKKIAMVLSIVLIIWIVTYIPDLISWFEKGAPNIAGSMKAESPHIELMREMFGLILSLIASSYYTFRKAG